MATRHFSALRAILAPRLVKLALGVVAVVAGYDSFSSQFGLPKLGHIAGMSGHLLPWWGWLLILQAVFVYALFEYVRRNVPMGKSSGEPISPVQEQTPAPPYDDSAIKAAQAAFEDRILSFVQGIQEQVDGFGSRINAIESRRVAGKRLATLQLGKEEFERLAADVSGAADQVVAAFKRVPQSLEQPIAVADTRSEADKALDNFKLQAVFTHGWAEKLGYECPTQFDDAAYVKNPHQAQAGESAELPEYYRGEYRRFIAQRKSCETVLHELRRKLNGEMGALRNTLEA